MTGTMDDSERELLEEALRKTMTAPADERGPLDGALTGLGWPEMLAETPADAIRTVFRLLGETGAHAPVLNDVLLHEAGAPPSGTVPMPYAGGLWVRWERNAAETEPVGIDPDLPVRVLPEPGAPVPLALGRQALGWWLVGTGHAMLTLARQHLLDRHQFGRPLAAFQALRHKLAETLVALEGAEATLLAADGDLSSLLAKAASGRAALTSARHCQQTLGGTGFTAEHDLHRHVKRALALDGLLGSARELTREAGRLIATRDKAPRLIHL
ncbi:acyl-CoA dehydrogenase family protein [Streptomyces endophyticus]|uniref:Acyl-CoA dehydrogenase family protein n=1 Tax=Streptomyces endophyticus TaxID=714166 RepID=A0ABU6EWQ1_9ACTN|nr:acyl-CoA dehydrogenase family protein [Streptomyces endophyticus]MEB8336170.1 acyl-CoA dehydrogenase family protein [Streptomyces endophyticus]